MGEGLGGCIKDGGNSPMGKKYTQALTHARISSYRKSTRTSSTPSLSTEIFNLTKSSHPVLSTTQPGQ
jgi:hypothetical protein